MKYYKVRAIVSEQERLAVVAAFNIREAAWRAEVYYEGKGYAKPQIEIKLVEEIAELFID